jgi:hypothetical protein
MGWDGETMQMQLQRSPSLLLPVQCSVTVLFSYKGLFSWQKVPKKSLHSICHIESLDVCMEH